MSRIVLIHWDSREAEARADRLRAAGHEVECHPGQGGEGLKAIQDDPPDAVIIDVKGQAPVGRALARWLRQQKTTRDVPIVFIEAGPDEARSIRAAVPDALHTGWNRAVAVLRRAIRLRSRPAAAPPLPSLPARLGIVPGCALLVRNAPRDLGRILGKLPPDVRRSRKPRPGADTALLFVNSREDLERRFSETGSALREGGRMWVAWRSLSGKLDEPSVRGYGTSCGYADQDLFVLDPDWSAVAFMRRRVDAG